MIIFGTYAFTYKRFRAGTHGIPSGAEVLMKCRVFQLFFIPFFPIGKVWVYRMGNEDLEVPNAIRRSIELTESIGFPFYAYAWILLIPFIYGGFKYSEHREREYWKAFELTSKQRYIDRIGQKIDTARQGDFFKVEVLDKPTHCSGKASFLLVEYATKDSLLMMHPAGYRTTYNPESYLSEQNEPVTYTWVARSDMRAAGITEPNDYACFKGIVLPGIFAGHQTKLGAYDHPRLQLLWKDLPHPSPPFSRFHPE